MRRAEREVTDRGQLLEIIGRCTCCRVAFSDPEGAYIVPLSFAFVPGQPDRFYFHGAKEGRKASLIAQKPKVGFELDCAYELVAGQSGCKYSCRYQSIVGTGVIGEVQDLEEKKQAVYLIQLTNHTWKKMNIPRKLRNDMEIHLVKTQKKILITNKKRAYLVDVSSL